MALPSKYHEGEIAMQQQAGAFDPADLENNGLGTAFDSRAEKFLASQRWAVIAGLDFQTGIWALLLHGDAGFLNVADAHTLNVRARLLPGDPLDQCFRQEQEIGMLVLDPSTRRRMRINGTAQWEDDQTLRVATREVYNNCPKYIQRRQPVADDHTPATSPTVLSMISKAHQDWIEHADTFFIASVHAEAGLDCSHRGGYPGFIRMTAERHLLFSDYSGNNMFQT